MHADYKDITSRISEEPTWWDENGTPRYGVFTPEACPSIYARRVGLFEIACQACGRHFQVEMHADIFGWRMTHPPREWHYGDPPRHSCVGDTMNCDDLAVVEMWMHEGLGDFERLPEFEGPID